MNLIKSFFEKCPKCLALCPVKPSKYQDRVGHITCACGVSSTILLSEYDNEKQVNHLRIIAKRIQKKISHVPLMHIQHDLAQYLGFKKWGDLIKEDAESLQLKIDSKDLKSLYE